MRFWYQNPASLHLANWEKLRLLIPFSGGFIGFGVFLAASLEVFGVSSILSWTVALIVTAATGVFTWQQLGRSIGQGVVRSYVEETFHPRQRGVRT